MNIVKHGPWRKKHVMFDEMMCQCVEADQETYPTITHVLERDEIHRDIDTSDDDVTIEPPTMLVPYEEFRELVFGLPPFESLPILANAFKGAGEPQYFIAKCFSGPDHQIGDQLIIDTQGYDYARYKAPIWGIEPYKKPG